jgi:hypothetical protein
MYIMLCDIIQIYSSFSHTTEHAGVCKTTKRRGAFLRALAYRKLAQQKAQGCENLQNSLGLLMKELFEGKDFPSYAPAGCTVFDCV